MACTIASGLGTPFGAFYIEKEWGIPQAYLIYLLPFLIGVILPIAVPFLLDFIQFRYKVGEGKRSNDA